MGQGGGAFHGTIEDLDADWRRRGLIVTSGSADVADRWPAVCPAAVEQEGGGTLMCQAPTRWLTTELGVESARCEEHEGGNG